VLTAPGTRESDIARAVDAGAAFCLPKPVSGAVLVAELRAACQRADADRELRARLHFAEEHATTDGLTGLMNRRAFDGRLAEGIANTARHHEPLSLVLLDLDFFKRTNDTFGHEAGDQLLLYFARALRRVVRLGDHAFRYGGEEFALLLPKCDAPGATRVVSRIQADLRARPVSLGDGHELIVRFSAGIATAEAGNGYRVEDLFVRADGALYKAKREGRDRVELST
jgi:diguanylate cyclase (GGDEF)-like protein